MEQNLGRRLGGVNHADTLLGIVIEDGLRFVLIDGEAPLNDFFVGVIDFFAVLLPGAIIVAIGYPHVPSFVLGEHGIVPPIEGETVRWIAFVVSAYLAGHILFMLGATIDTALYDSLRIYVVPKEDDKTFQAAKEIRDAMLAGFDPDINVFQ